MSYPNGPGPHRPALPPGHAPGPLSGGRLAASIAWALAPLYTCGAGTFVVIAVAAIRLRSRLHGAAAAVYFLVFACWFLSVDTALEDEAWFATASMIAWFFLAVGGLVHTFLVREQVFRPGPRPAVPPPAPPPAPPRPVPPAPQAPFSGPRPVPPAPAAPLSAPREPVSPLRTPPTWHAAPRPAPPVPPGPATAGPPVVGPATAGPPVTGPATAGPPLTGPATAGPPAVGPASPGLRGRPTMPSQAAWNPPPYRPQPAPRRLGPYLLLSKLGEGGQGTVYLAQHPDGSRVALKTLHHRLSEGERDGFMRELAAARRVPSYSTARVLDAGVIDDIAFIVSEYVPGVSLQRRVHESGPLDGDSLIRLAIATSGALAAIHQAGIVHRDFKPANVLLAADGPRVIDFGLAKVLDQVTTTAGIKGTPVYMSPEQINGDPVGPASDMFSWASTMIFGGTGRVAFAGSNPYQVLHQIMMKEPDLSGLPEPLIRPIAACLDKDPRNRPKASELIAAITGG